MLLSAQTAGAATSSAIAGEASTRRSTSARQQIRHCVTKHSIRSNVQPTTARTWHSSSEVSSSCSLSTHLRMAKAARRPRKSVNSRKSSSSTHTRQTPNSAIPKAFPTTGIRFAACCARIAGSRPTARRHSERRLTFNENGPGSLRGRLCLHGGAGAKPVHRILFLRGTHAAIFMTPVPSVTLVMANPPPPTMPKLTANCAGFPRCVG